jgi:hypothetical protein
MGRGCALALLVGWGVVVGSAEAAMPAGGATAQWSTKRVLYIDFARSMRTWDNDAPGVRLTPALPVTCHWASDTRLACTASRDSRGATPYQVRLPEGLWTQGGDAMAAMRLDAPSGRPSVEARPGAWKNGLPIGELSTEMPVTQAALAAVLVADIDGDPVSLKLRPRPERYLKPGTAYSVDLVDAADRHGLLTLRIRPGLASSEGPLRGIQDEVLATASLQPVTALLTGVRCSHRGRDVEVATHDGRLEATCSPGDRVTLVFNQKLDEAAQAAVTQRLQAGLRSDDGRPAGDVRFGIAYQPPKDRNDREWRPLRQAVFLDELESTGTLTAQFDASIRTQGIALTPVALTLRLEATHPQVRAHARKVLVADGRRPPVLVEALNAVAADYQVSGVGQRAGEERIALAARDIDDRPHAVDSALTRRLLAEAGWVNWQRVEDTGQARQPRMVEFAAPGFDLLAVAGRREVLAWANAWEGDAPIVGAEFELLWRASAHDPLRVVARGRTQADGTVLLRLPDDVALPEPEGGQKADAAHPQWLLRASAGRAQAVLPLADAGPLGTAFERSAWGVTDRPLYRAGDTVQYRLWQREIHGGALRALRAAPAAPLTLRLHSDEGDRDLLVWTQVADADGSVHGTLKLPEHMTDDLHCIVVDAAEEASDGACFYVGTHRTQDVWVEVKTPGGIVRDGDMVQVEVAAGYYSGGTAAGIGPTAGLEVEPIAFTEIYPAYVDYAFASPDDQDPVDLRAPAAALPALDVQGNARQGWPVHFEDADDRPAFGRINVSVEVAPDDRDSTYGYDGATLYAAFDRYVGLRTLPAWFGQAEPVKVEAVVADAHGREVPDAPVEVTVEYLPSAKDERGTVVGRCTLRVRTASDCDFPRARSGRYRLSARSPGAAPVELERYVWTSEVRVTADVASDLALRDLSPQGDGPVRARLTQKLSHARALFVVASGGTLLGHRVENVDGPVQEFDLPVQPQWRGVLDVSALVRGAAPPAREDGYRDPAPLERLSANAFRLDTRPPVPGVSLQFAPARGEPGQVSVLTVRNVDARPRSVALSVVDDALRAQAQPFLALAQPEWWIERAARSSSSLGHAGFDGWMGEAPWRDLLPWPKQVTGDQPDVVEGVEAPGAIMLRGNFDGMESSGYLGQYDGGGAADDLDRITVTGSRINQVDLLQKTAPTMRVERDRSPGERSPGRHAPYEQNGADGDARPDTGAWHLRTAFAETAFWLSDLQLQPGETREFRITLPDNLTRWKAVAWSADADGDVVQDEAALESGLPVEARLQVPVRVYPGDTARLAASVRHVAEVAATAQATIDLRGPAADDAASAHSDTLRLAPAGQASTATIVQPTTPGTLEVVARAETSAGRDAVAASVEVASPRIAARRVQAGWLGEGAREMALPALPEGATDARLHVDVLRGNAGLTAQWTRDLHAYPHRCWEQMLSRAVGAALALERGDASWPQAQEAIDEALRNAAVFQNGDGGFNYFTDGDGGGYSTPDAHVALSAWSARALAELESRGHAVPGNVLRNARAFVAQVDAPETDDEQAPTYEQIDDLVRFAYTAAALEPASAAAATTEEGDGPAAPAEEQRSGLDLLWSQWDQLPLPGQVAAARALARAAHPSARDATSRLLARAPLRGEARRLSLPRRYDQWMSSDLREQCALIDLLGEHPALAAPGTRQQLLAGLGDLYGGGVAAVDTQAAAVCLLALREPARSARPAASLQVAVGARSERLVLAPQADRVEWTIDAPAAPLRLSGASAEAPVSYVAALEFVEDARTAQASAVGFRLQRRYAVLREGQWADVDAQHLREGDWIRVSLQLDTAAPRDFVAITDDVPGGLRPTDLALAGVASGQLERVADQGSAWFETRRLDPRRPRFYATRVPAGTHVVHYFARVGNTGDYLAAPAVAELMYGQATHARTAADRLRFDAPAGRPAR